MSLDGELILLLDRSESPRPQIKLAISYMEHRVKKARYNLIQIFIPFDVILTILSRLPPSSLGRFRCVCKQWHAFLSDPVFLESIRTRTLSRLKIISRYVNMKKMLSYDFDCENRLQEKPVELNLGRSSCYSFSNIVNRLTCAHGNSAKSNIYLLDPVANESIRLPGRPQEGIGKVHDESFGLGFDPSTGVYKVVRLFRRCGSTSCEIVTMHILNSKARQWRYIGEIPHQIQHNVPPVFLDGALHWKPSGFADPLALLAFDIKEEKFRWLEPKPHTLHPQSIFLDLKESDGRLYLLYYPFGSNMQTDVWILQDYKKCIWEHRWSVNVKGIVRSLDEAPALIDWAGGHCLLKVLDKNCWRWRIYHYDFLTNRVYKIHGGTSLEPILYTNKLV